MTETLILGVAVVAGLACPVHMWWQHRRGRGAACFPAPSSREQTEPVDVALRERQRRLAAMIAERQAAASATPPAGDRATR